MFSITARVTEISKSWPPPIRRELNRYLRRFYREENRESDGVAGTFRQPYWLFLPAWLRKEYNRDRSNRISKKIFDDILWAQYCVFLSIRIKDDLYDGEIIRSPLFFGADQFLGEACDIFQCHLNHIQSFRPVFTAALRDTINGFWEVDAMQQRRRVSLSRMRAEYARVSSIFKLGSASICHLGRHLRDFSMVASASDELAIAGQVLDDFQDMNEDLSRGRINYAARFILGSSGAFSKDRKETLQILAECMLYTDRVIKLFDDVIGHIRAAERILSRLKLPDATRYFPRYVESLEKVRDRLGQEQIDHIWGTVKPKSFE